MRLASAERADVVVDFGAYPVGTEIIVRNRLDSGPVGDVMRFRVARNGTDDSAVPARLTDVEVLSRRNGKAPAPMDAGWKDTVDLHPYEVVEVLVKFSGFAGRYVMHCHNLEHEDMAMMANFDVV
ncbi:MAG TPA: multicopper oxidase domain-containing protein [Jiangellaceae bacterium]